MVALPEPHARLPGADRTPRRRLIAEHEQQRSVHAEEHTARTECVFCDVIHRASAMLLDATREGCQ
jgi:hypothetical protein